jgi:hypothetical protein
MTSIQGELASHPGAAALPTPARFTELVRSEAEK